MRSQAEPGNEGTDKTLRDKDRAKRRTLPLVRRPPSLLDAVLVAGLTFAYIAFKPLAIVTAVAADWFSTGCIRSCQVQVATGLRRDVGKAAQGYAGSFRDYVVGLALTGSRRTAYQRDIDITATRPASELIDFTASSGDPLVPSDLQFAERLITVMILDGFFPTAGLHPLMQELYKLAWSALGDQELNDGMTLSIQGQNVIRVILEREHAIERQGSAAAHKVDEHLLVLVLFRRMLDRGASPFISPARHVHVQWCKVTGQDRMGNLMWQDTIQDTLRRALDGHLPIANIAVVESKTSLTTGAQLRTARDLDGQRRDQGGNSVPSQWIASSRRKRSASVETLAANCGSRHRTMKFSLWPLPAGEADEAEDAAVGCSDESTSGKRGTIEAGSLGLPAAPVTIPGLPNIGRP